MSSNELIKWYNGMPIITMNDFEIFLGIRIRSKKGGYRYGLFKEQYFKPGVDWNGLGQGEKREKFERINNVHYEEETFIYLSPKGSIKVIKQLACRKAIKLNSSKVYSFVSELEKYMRNDIIFEDI